ncbi:efflux RND transporter permease subunit [Aeromonas media]|uniref:efflux RND transporter permease subunit n=1 Tax=Aeromonas media TaxID=651 RepID=UPI003D1B616C
MISFFINRPVFAWVIAIMIMLSGVVAIRSLPVAQYPTIAPPTVSVSASYPGASSKAIEDSVTQIIEQNMKGIDGLLYMSSSSDSSGSANVTMTFSNDTDPDTAQVQVQNKMQSVLNMLPESVQRQGVRVNKSRSGFLMVLAVLSEDGSMSRDDISDYLNANLTDPLSRVDGVGSVQVFGSQYAMRVWLDPHKLKQHKLTSTEITNAIKTENAQMAFGEVGATPSVPGQELNATIVARGRFENVDQFKNVIIKSNQDGSKVRLSDVARVELGAENYAFASRFNGATASGVAISMATGANAMTTAKGVNNKIAEMSSNLPHGLKVVTAYDTTPFVKVSIKGVVSTLIEAIVLVFAVMYLFLQNVRATLIPTITIPVVLLGTFGMLFALGFSINMLTMFALVLAIGLLVDDAIVVVENVERIMTEEGLSPLEATRKSMGQISGALVGIGLVLSAVFVPMAFMTGSTGIIYQQFTATIVSAMALSVFIAMILTPSLCVSLLKPVKKGEHAKVNRFFEWFNRSFDSGSDKYQRGVKGLIARPARTFAMFVVIAGVMGVMYSKLPSSFLPAEDQGMLMVMITTPEGSTQERTLESVAKMESHFLENEKETVSGVFAVQGFGMGGSAQNTAMGFIRLKDWSERKAPGQSAAEIAGRAMMSLSKVKDAQIFVMSPPAMPELGNSEGFNFFLKDNAGLGREALDAARDQLIQSASKSPLLTSVRINGLNSAPQLRIEFDTDKAASLGVSLGTVNSTLSTAWGGSYIDDFIDRGRVKKVYLQSDAKFRMSPEDFAAWDVKNDKGEMVSISSFASMKWERSSPRLTRYNGAPAVEINGQPAQGVSSGDAMAEMERLVAELPQGIGMEWSGISYQERQVGAQTTILYAASLLAVFLCLAALYESWAIPTAVILAAPLGILGTVLSSTMFGMSRDVYFQVAMLTTVGLTSKNAILIVEFAKDHIEKEGMKLIDATLLAVKLRLRPIVMTSLAFGLGVLPLAIASGAGSGAQNAIGIGVLGGMLVGTVLGLLLVPLFFVLIFSLSKKEALTQNTENPFAHGSSEELSSLIKQVIEKPNVLVEKHNK